MVAAQVGGCQWPRLQVEFRCDNHTVVAIINSGSLRGPLCVHLMRRLALVACQFQFRSPLAMSTVIPGPPPILSLGLTVRAFTGFLPPPIRLLPASLQLSYRRCSPCIRVAVFNLCSSGVSDLVSPYVCLWKDEVGVILALGPDLFPSSPVPTSAYQLRTFVSWLAQSLSAVSVDDSLAVVRSYCIDWGYSDQTPRKPRFFRVLRGIHRYHGAASPPRRSITLGIWCSIHRILSLPNSGSDSVMFWSACSLTFVDFLRDSEFTASPPIEHARHLAPTAVEFCQAIHHRGVRLCFKFSQSIRLVLVILSTSVLPVHIDAPSWLFATTSPIVGLSPARSWCG